MEYNFKLKSNGKHYSMMLNLKENIEKGLGCAVATPDPEKTKRDFKYMTGCELNLVPCADCDNLYSATLNEEMMEDDYEVFIPLYEDGLIFKRWKSSADREGYTYFDTFKEAKADLISYYKNTIQECEVLLRKTKKIKASIEHEV